MPLYALMACLSFPMAHGANISLPDQVKNPNFFLFQKATAFYMSLLNNITVNIICQLKTGHQYVDELS
jgi:hypothetical protein